MKKIPKIPIIFNLIEEWSRCHPDIKKGIIYSYDEYIDWFRQFGFKMPIDSDYLEFPDDYPDEKISMLILKWS